MADNETTPGGVPAHSERWIGGGFWVVVILVFAWYLWPSAATVFLNVTTDGSLAIRGAVAFHGAPVADGKVHVTIDEARTQRYVASITVPIVTGGAFEASAETLKLPADAVQVPLQITAQFVGRAETGKDKQGQPAYESISGTSTVYLRFSPPLLGRTALWTIIVVGVALGASLTTLFTGDLTPRRARTLFMLTYLMTFTSVALPIAVTLALARNDYFVSMMQTAPIGLVKGKAKGTGAPQWLLNIGGAVREASSRLPSTPPPGTPPPQKGGDGSEKKGPNQPTPSPPGDERVDVVRSGDVEVEGGLAVPFFVVFLAMLGAGINMTIQVPRIQLSYTTEGTPPSGFLAATAQVVMTMVGARPQAEPLDIGAMARVRRELIDNYMYLMSAPILSIAVYYLLQVVGANTTEPVVVLLAFATGFTSDKLVARIIEFAENYMASDAQKQRREDDKKRIEEAKKQADSAASDAPKPKVEGEKAKAEERKRIEEAKKQAGSAAADAPKAKVMDSSAPAGGLPGERKPDAPAQKPPEPGGTTGP